MIVSTKKLWGEVFHSKRTAVDPLPVVSGSRSRNFVVDGGSDGTSSIAVASVMGLRLLLAYAKGNVAVAEGKPDGQRLFGVKSVATEGKEYLVLVDDGKITIGAYQDGSPIALLEEEVMSHYPVFAPLAWDIMKGYVCHVKGGDPIPTTGWDGITELIESGDVSGLAQSHCFFWCDGLYSFRNHYLGDGDELTCGAVADFDFSEFEEVKGANLAAFESFDVKINGLTAGLTATGAATTEEDETSSTEETTVSGEESVESKKGIPSAMRAIVEKMAKVGNLINEYLTREGISSTCSLRSLAKWAKDVRRGADPYEAAEHTVVLKVASDEDARVNIRNVVSSMFTPPTRPKTLTPKVDFGAFDIGFDWSKVEGESAKDYVPADCNLTNLSPEFVEIATTLQTAVGEAPESSYDDKNIILQGPAGTGKTTFCQKLALALNCPYYSEITDPDKTGIKLFGEFAPKEDSEGFMLVRTPLVEAVRNGGIFECQEMNNGNPSDLLLLNELLDGCQQLHLPNGEVVRRHPHFIFIATQNPAGGGYLRSEIDFSLIDRFGSVYEFDAPDEELMARIIAERAGL